MMCEMKRLAFSHGPWSHVHKMHNHRKKIGLYEASRKCRALYCTVRKGKDKMTNKMNHIIRFPLPFLV